MGKLMVHARFALGHWKRSDHLFLATNILRLSENSIWHPIPLTSRNKLSVEGTV